MIDYKFNNYEKMSSKKLSKIFRAFSKYITDAYLKYTSLKKRYEMFKKNVGLCNDWLIAQINTGTNTSTPGIYKVTGYHSPTSYTDIKHERVYGTFTLDAQNNTGASLIGRMTDANGNIVPKPSITLYYSYDNSSWVTEESLNSVVDGTDTIWIKESSNQDVWVSIQTPNILSSVVNSVYVYPVAGTKLKEISYKRTGNQWTTIAYDTEYSVLETRRITDYDKEIRVKLNGIYHGGQYLFGLKNIDIMGYTYKETGTIKFTTPAMTTITNILINTTDDYIYPVNLKLSENNPIRIRILDLTEATEFYDSNDSNYPILNNISLGTSQQTILEITLNKTSDITPYLKKVRIDYS